MSNRSLIVLNVLKVNRNHSLQNSNQEGVGLKSEKSCLHAKIAKRSLNLSFFQEGVTAFANKQFSLMKLRPLKNWKSFKLTINLTALPVCYFKIDYFYNCLFVLLDVFKMCLPLLSRKTPSFDWPANMPVWVLVLPPSACRVCLVKHFSLVSRENLS